MRRQGDHISKELDEVRAAQAAVAAAIGGDGDIAESAHRLSAAVDAYLAVLRPAEVWVLRHEDQHGDDVSLHVSEQTGLGALAQTCRSRWDNAADEAGVPPTGDHLNDATAVKIYFARRRGIESYALYSDEVDGTGARAG